MKISRRGSSADRGIREIELDKPRVTWNKDNKSVQFYQTRIPDFVTDSRHDYTISISLSEIAKILKLIGNDIVSQEYESISKELSPCLREIIRIEKTCIGDINVHESINNNNA